MFAMHEHETTTLKSIFFFEEIHEMNCQNLLRFSLQLLVRIEACQTVTCTMATHLLVVNMHMSAANYDSSTNEYSEIR